VSIRAQVAAWVAVIAAAGAWSWHLARFNGLQLVVMLGALSVAGWLVVRDIDRQRPGRLDNVDRMADPARRKGDGC
jgi:hypothetical protein